MRESSLLSGRVRARAISRSRREKMVYARKGHAENQGPLARGSGLRPFRFASRALGKSALAKEKTKGKMLVRGLTYCW